MTCVTCGNCGDLVAFPYSVNRKDGPPLLVCLACFDSQRVAVTPAVDTRTFDTGAYRDTNDGKPDYEGCLSPIALEAYADYMRRKQTMADGTLRASDNWQLGMTKAEWLKSLYRHLIQLAKLHRGYAVLDKGGPVTLRDACCGVLFNAFGYLHELVKGDL